MALSIVNVDFAKEQLALMFLDDYLHPSGQIPAFEWNFSDVNPPVQAWATIFLHRTEEALHGKGRIDNYCFKPGVKAALLSFFGKE